MPTNNATVTCDIPEEIQHNFRNIPDIDYVTNPTMDYDDIDLSVLYIDANF